MKFEWNARKAALNLKKHGVTFEEAATVFRDTLSVTGHDPDHSTNEERFITFGVSSLKRLLVGSHADRKDAVRMISARMATKRERKIYEEG